MASPPRRLSAVEAEQMARRAAAALADRGLVADDRVALQAPSSPELIAVAMGALRTGIVPVPVNPALLPHEQAAIVDDADVSLSLDDEGVRAAVAFDRDAELAPYPLARPMHYTSGTSGDPKGVWSGLLDEAAAARLTLEEREQWGFDAADTHLVCSPLHHSAPLRFAIGTLLAGGDVVVLGPFDAPRFAATVAAEQPTTAFCVPSHLQRLLALGPQRFDSFRLVAHGGAPCPDQLKRSAFERFSKGVLWEFLGSTEGQFTACPPDEWLDHPGTVGRARQGRQLRIAGDGTVWCRVPDHARFEYWRKPTATAEAWDGDRFSVGDLGRLDDDGYLYLEGRRGDLIISGGVNVWPAEIERVIGSLVGVVQVAVFPATDDRWGQRVCAAVVGSVTPDEIDRHCREQLAPHKRPKQILVLPELPLTTNGKVRRATLATDLGLSP